MGTTLDSGFVIDLLKGHAPAVRKARDLAQSKASTYLSTPVLYEVLAGILHRQSRTEASAFHSLAERFSILPFDEPSARRAAEVRAEFMKLGKAKPGVDVMIAGIALSGDHTLLSRDSDFEPIEAEFGLRLVSY